LYFKWCGERATDPSEGVFTYGDFRSRGYCQAVLELLELDAYGSLLPELVDGTQHAAKLCADAANATGLASGTPVVLGPVDIICSGLGGGMYEPDRNVGYSIIGSAGIHMRIYHSLEDIELHDQAGYVMPFVAPGTWAEMMSNMAATLNIDWMLDMAEELMGVFGQAPGRKAILETLDGLAARAEPGKVLFHPFIFESGERGPFVNPSARAQFLGLTNQVGFVDLFRGVYESLGLAARDCHKGLGHSPDEVRVGGRHAQRHHPPNPFWRPRRSAASGGTRGTRSGARGHLRQTVARLSRWLPTHGRILEPIGGVSQRWLNRRTAGSPSSATAL
jgi:erythritol kinase